MRCPTGLVLLLRRSVIASLVFLFASGPAATSQSVRPNQAHLSYAQGTCVIVVWRGSQLALATDGRSIHTSSRFDGFAANDRSVSSDECKLRKPSPRVLLSFEGLSTIVRASDNKLIWSGLGNANEIFSELRQPELSLPEVMIKASRWQDTFQLAVDKGAVSAQTFPEGSDVAALQVLTYIGMHPVIVNARFSIQSGIVRRILPYEVPPPNDQQIKVIKYGSCNRVLGDSVQRTDFTAQEKERYRNLHDIE
jgi:hypothetical protein